MSQNLQELVSKETYDSINKLYQKCEPNKEFEASVYGSNDNNVKLEQYLRIMDYFRAMKKHYKMKIIKTVMLDISYTPSRENTNMINYRLSVNTMPQIKKMLRMFHLR